MDQTRGGLNSSKLKKRTREEITADEAGSDDDDENIIGTEIPAEFVLENFDADVDYWPVKNLLATFLEGAEAGSGFHPGELADLILEQNGVTDSGAPPGANGSVITLEGQEDVFGFFTVIDVSKYNKRGCIQSVLRYAISKAPLADRTKWSSILNDQSIKVGLILSERLPNVPEQLAAPLVIQTFQELQASRSKFDYYLMITTVYREGVDESLASGDAQLPSSKRSKISERKPVVQPVQYYKLEDEFFIKGASLKSTFKLMRNSQANRWTLSMFAQLSKVVLLISSDRMPNIVQELHSLAE